MRSWRRRWRDAGISGDFAVPLWTSLKHTAASAWITGTTYTATIAVDAGDLILAAVVTHDTTGTAPTVTDAQGNTYAVVDHQANGNSGGSSIFLFWAAAASASAGLTVTAVGPAGSSSGSLTLSTFNPGAGAAISVLDHAVASPGQDMKTRALAWTPGIIGLDFAVATSNGFAQGTCTPATGYTLIGNTQQSFAVIGVASWYKANDSGGSATPEATFQNGTYGGIVAATFGATPSVGYTLSGPGSVRAGEPASFTLAPSGTDTDTVTLSDGGHGGTFSPTSLSWSGTSGAKGFTYANPTPGTYSIAATSAAGGAVSGSPASLLVTPAAGGPPTRTPGGALKWCPPRPRARSR
jgi:hypothetical protein